MPIVSFFIPTSAINETDFITIHNQLSFLVWHIPKHNVLIIGGDLYVHISKRLNDKFY